MSKFRIGDGDEYEGDVVNGQPNGKDAEGARRSRVLNLCGSAGAPMNLPVCRIRREGFSLSGGRMEQ